MAYVPTNWKTGDTITADKLNNIENGIASSGGGGGGGALILEPEATETDMNLKTSYNVIKNAFLSGKNIILSFSVEAQGRQLYIYSHFMITASQEMIQGDDSMAVLSGNFLYQGLTENFEIQITDFDADVVIDISK